MITQAGRDWRAHRTGSSAGRDSAVATALPLLLAAARAERCLERLQHEAARQPEIVAGYLMRGQRGAWKDAVEDLPTPDLEALIRLLTLAEADLPGWQGGSASTVIWLFQLHAGRPEADEHALANWILKHGSNPYAPYGTRNHGARSIEEYRARRQAALEEETSPAPPASPSDPHSWSLGFVRALGSILPMG